MKLILSAGSLYTLPMEKVFNLARQTGFDGLEVIINHDFEFQNGVNLIRRLQEIHPIYSLHAPFFFVDGWGDKIEQVLKTAALAQETDIPLINFHPPMWMGLEVKFFRWFKNVKDFQAEIGNNQVLITIENMPSMGPFKVNPYVLSRTEPLIEFLKDHNLLLTFDTAHMGSSKANFLNDFHQCYDSGRMRNIHFSDFGHGREHLLPGRGILPLTRFLNHLRETHYDRTLTLELSPHEFPEEEELIQESLREIFEFLCRETLRAGEAGEAAPAFSAGDTGGIEEQKDGEDGVD